MINYGFGAFGQEIKIKSAKEFTLATYMRMSLIMGEGKADLLSRGLYIGMTDGLENLNSLPASALSK